MAGFKRIAFIFLLPVLLILFLAGCEKTYLFSSWREQEITIDAKYSDWQQTAAHYDEKSKITLNLANDERDLYICLITRNRQIEIEAMESGFSVWFDPQGGQKKSFGVRFPISLRAMGMSIEEENKDHGKYWRDQEDMSGLVDRKKERLSDRAFNQRLEMLEGLQERLEIVDDAPQPKKKGRLEEGLAKSAERDFSLQEAGKFGIEARVGRENDYFVYELKVPLVRSADHPHAIGIKEGQALGLGFEIGGMKKQMALGRKMPEDEPEREDLPERGAPGTGGDFRLWITVILASKEG
ncbi:MAG: hypothetical protein PHS09_06440 [Candidatus Omnitrophica bacterium]|nr:hypothetical protein [Candidatus Omnitrophota bacterium]MDD5513222.1 hypothetical protein [Candidatus Omnitrophota bacterium]